MTMASMQAVTFRAFGGPEVLELAEVDRPEPGADDVLVRVHAAGICYHDVLSRAAGFPEAVPAGFWAMRSPARSRRWADMLRASAWANAS